MKPATRLRAASPFLVGLVALPAPLLAQDACPRASGPDAEAGWAAYAANDMSEARARFGAALTRCADDHYARTGLGYVLLRDGQTAEAVGLWSAVVSAQPNNVDALTGLGLAAWRQGDLESVQARFEHVVQLAPDHATALEYLARLRGVEGSANPASDAADEAWAAGDTPLALALYLLRLEDDPGDELALLRVGLMRAWQGDFDQAVELLDILIESAPGHLDARLARARVRAWSGDVPRARREVLEILAAQPDHAEALEALALFQAWAGDVEEALDSYDNLTAIAPEGGSVGRQRAQALAWASRFEASRAAYDALLARDPLDIEARLGLAQTLAYSQDFDAALAEYDTVLEAAPGDVRALVGRARTLGWAGRLVEGERVAVQALESDRSSAAAWAGLGQLYRWQGRPAAAKTALETAARIAPTDAEVLDQLRSIDLMLAPVARPSVVFEDDSDGNRMLTTTLTTSWHPTPRMDVRARGYYKSLEQRIGLTTLDRVAQGVTITTTYQISPGWLLSGGVGGSTSDGLGDPSFLAYQAGLRTPERYDLVWSVDVSSQGLDETAALAERGVRSTLGILAGRWTPGRVWRLDGSVGLGVYDGSESNGRRSASLSASRRVGRFFSLGAGVRGFSFEKNLFDGYFDPDFYGLAELTSYWLYRPGAWTLLIELAPGIQQVTTDGDPGAALRTNARVAYRVAPGREISLSGGYSTAGLTSFATGASGYDYLAVILGFNWAF